MLQDVLELGGKIDVRPLKKDAHRQKNGKNQPTMVSQLDEIKGNDEVIIHMPMYQGKMVLLTAGTCYDLVFYTKNGLYQAVGHVMERYKEDNFFFLKIALLTPLKKYQRREYFRLGCMLDMEVYEIDRESALKLDSSELELRICGDVETIMTEAKALIVDISGGGIRFIGDKRYEEEQSLVIHTLLSNETTHQELTVAISVVSSRRIDNDTSRFETRAEFLNVGEWLREEIIKYIFDEDRKIRKKDIGV